MADLEFASALKKVDEVDLTVVGRKTGADHTFPVWFVLEGEKLYLLPIYGTHSNWYRNLIAHPMLKIAVGENSIQAAPVFITVKDRVEQVVALFRARYGAGDVASYYSRFDAAVEVDL